MSDVPQQPDDPGPPRQKSLIEIQDESPGCGRWFAGYVMSILLPVVGIALWLLLYTKDDPKLWRQSETYLVRAIVGTVMGLLLFGAIIGTNPFPKPLRSRYACVFLLSRCG